MNIVEVLRKNNLTISCAESLTCGLVAANIANISGASNVLKGGVASYSKEAKCKLLGLSMDDINKYGVYSFETAVAMAKGIKDALGTDASIATTGVAGPGDDEGIKEGTVFFAVIINDNIYKFKEIFTGNRNEVRQKAAEFIISKVIEILM